MTTQQEGPEQGESESPVSPPADVCETTAQEPTFPSQPQTVIHVLPAGQSQLPTEHHMICSDIRSARDSPSASPFHACGLHHSVPWLTSKQVVQSQELLFSYNFFFFVAWFLLCLTEGEKQQKLRLDLFTACVQPKHGSNWRPTPGLD